MEEDEEIAGLLESIDGFVSGMLIRVQDRNLPIRPARRRQIVGRLKTVEERVVHVAALVRNATE